MEIKLTHDESLEIFHLALCNGLGYIRGYGITVDYNEQDYKTASNSIKNGCWEDVLVQILINGKPLLFVDEESEETHEVLLSDVIKKVSTTDAKNLLNIINEEDDAIDSDCVLQTVIYGEVIYG